ncbi:hypothetical protein ACP70R_042531 [Stipagrostis hirtigluma subsp. patula]
MPAAVHRRRRAPPFSPSHSRSHHASDASRLQSDAATTPSPRAATDVAASPAHGIPTRLPATAPQICAGRIRCVG